jgi:FMN hydrolase / 5-amino-6-(5-phospho-D-ribitylamino)uracil phosphatase
VNRGEIRAISFDLDDSLWAIMPVIMRAEQAIHNLLERHFPEVARRYDIEAMRLMRERVVQAHPHVAHDLAELRRLAFVELLEECGYDAIHADHLIEEFMEWRHRVELFDDVLPSLQRLASRYRLFAVSNGNASLARLGLDDYFVGQISAQSEGVGKPDPRIFHAACRILDLDPNQVLHIGDHPLDDVRGALDAGLKAAWLNRTGAEWEYDFIPHLTCSDLQEFSTLLME